jgi:hypothetical protein
VHESTDLFQDIGSFIDTLLGLNLIEKSAVDSEIDSTGISDVELPEDYLRRDWVSPLLVSNDELSDLLKIDPIHDVTESGWPESPRS